MSTTTFRPGQAVRVPLLREQTAGTIIRKQGAHGYMIRYATTRTIQEWATGAVKTEETHKTGFWKTSEITPNA